MRYCLLCILFLFSCSGERLDKNMLVRDYYNERVSVFVNEKEELCKERIRLEAQQKIDSLIDTWVNAELIDTILFPSKPRKPNRPPDIIDSYQSFDIDSSFIEKN